jgi:vacuolar iron transporter family protein
MKRSLKIGVNFGLTSGVITTLGLIVGLHSGTHSKMVILGGILTIAIADAFSDALGMHVSEESEGKYSTREVWESTISTFLAKFLMASTFIVPIIFLELETAILASIIWGLSIITILSFQMARKEKEAAWKVIGEHLLIAIIVIIATHYTGEWITKIFEN